MCPVCVLTVFFFFFFFFFFDKKAVSYYYVFFFFFVFFFVFFFMFFFFIVSMTANYANNGMIVGWKRIFSNLHLLKYLKFECVCHEISIFINQW